MKLTKIFTAAAAVALMGIAALTGAAPALAGGFGVPGGAPVPPPGNSRVTDIHGNPIHLSPEILHWNGCVTANRGTARCGPRPTN